MKPFSVGSTFISCFPHFRVRVLLIKNWGGLVWADYFSVRWRRGALWSQRWFFFCLFVVFFSFLTHLRKRIKRECLKFHQHVCSLQSSRDQCQMLHVHAHYFNKTHFAFCDCFIKRIADDLGLFVKAFAQRNESCSFWIKLGLRQDPLFCLIIRTTASSGLCHQLGPLEHAWVSNHTRQTRLLCIVFH